MYILDLQQSSLIKKQNKSLKYEEILVKICFVKEYI